MTSAEIALAFILLVMAIGSCSNSDQFSAMRFDLGLISVTINNDAGEQTLNSGQHNLIRMMVGSDK